VRIREQASATSAVDRQINLFVQSQLRTETSGGAYADQISNVLAQLQSLYGTPGGTGTLETAYNNFTSALQALSANSGAQSARSLALTTAQSLAQELNTTTQGIQQLRSNAQQDIGVSVNQVNNDLTQMRNSIRSSRPFLRTTIMPQRCRISATTRSTISRS